MTTDSKPVRSIGLIPSVYFADSFVRCNLEHAWTILWEFERWNPTFSGATITPISGRERSEGEIVKISKKVAGPDGQPFPAFYSETLKIVPNRRVVWYAYAEKGHKYLGQEDPFRNFIDFGLTEEPGGVRFNIYYYAQNRLSGDLLATERGLMDTFLQQLLAAFRDCCETPS